MSLWRWQKGMGWVVAMALFLSVVPAFAQTGGLTGVAKGEKGDVLVGYPIIIERQDVKGTYKTKTNKKGEYIYIGLPIGNYKVSLQDPNGRELFFVQTRVGLGDPTPLDFDLGKERVRTAEERQKQLEANPELKRQQEAQEKDQKQFTGLKATFDQGQLLMNEKRYAEAAAMFEQALPLAKEKNVPVILAKLGESYQKAKVYDKAIDYYQKALAAKPEDASLHNNLGNVYAEMGKTTEAADEFKKAADADPAQASRYYFNYGAVMYNVGKMDDASAAFGKATEIDPNFADSYFMRGRALMGKLDMDPKTGKVVAAPGTVEALETYLKLDPQGKYSAEAQGMLQTVQGGVQTEYKKTKKAKT